MQPARASLPDFSPLSLLVVRDDAATKTGGKNYSNFCFPETDTWLAVFRTGMGLQVLVYALFLRSDWHYLFAATGKGLVSRELGEAIASFDSPLTPKLGWLVFLGRHIGLGEETLLWVAWACLL
jgi:hypothetical protein